MIAHHEACVRALADTLARQAGCEDQRAHADVADHLLAVRARMPAHLRGGVGALTILFDLAPCLRGAAPFHRLPLPDRTMAVRRWEGARMGPPRSLIAFYRTLATFAVHSIRHEAREGTSIG